jgi:hypothetical protein
MVAEYYNSVVAKLSQHVSTALSADGWRMMAFSASRAKPRRVWIGRVEEPRPLAIGPRIEQVRIESGILHDRVSDQEAAKLRIAPLCDQTFGAREFRKSETSLI